MLFYERKSWHRRQPNTILKYLLDCAPFQSASSGSAGQPLLPEQHGCAEAPCVQLPAGREVPQLSCSLGPARYAPTFFISPDVWSPFCFEIVLHPGQSISALALSHSS